MGLCRGEGVPLRAGSAGRDPRAAQGTSGALGVGAFPGETSQAVCSAVPSAALLFRGYAAALKIYPWPYFFFLILF